MSRLKLSNSELAVFCRQSLLVVKAGITLSSGIDYFKCDTNLDDNANEAIQEIFAAVENGINFSSAIEASDKFPAHLVAMVRIGEETGNLEKALVSLTRFYEQSERVRQKAVNAVTYPIILLTIMLGVLAFLIIQVLPQFNEILLSMGGQMPATAAVILATGKFLKSYGLYVIFTAIAFIIVLWYYLKSNTGKKFLDQIIFRLPLTSRTAQKLATARFCNGMSMALGSGVDFAGAVTMTSTIMGNTYMTDKVLNMKKLMDNGFDLAEALARTNLFPTMFTKLFTTAYKTGQIDDLLLRMADYYEDSLDSSLQRLTAIIEPTLVIILTAIVGVILFSVMLPIINIMQLIG